MRFVQAILASALILVTGCADNPLVPDDGADGPWQGPGSEPDWAGPQEAKIRPGVQMRTSSGQCTSNFVYTDHSGAVYLGFAAHCAASGMATDTNGCSKDVRPLPMDTSVEISGATKPGRLAYSSWATMQRANETSGDACAYNDFALVALDPADWSLTNPAVPIFGGPSEVYREPSVPPRTKVVSYGNSSLRPRAVDEFNPREGYIVDNYGNGWTHDVVFLTSGVPGDSGSGVLLADGRALGVLVTLGTGTNGITNLPKALEYARDHDGPDVELVTSKPTSGGRLPTVAPENSA